jgi:outer membrane translocation and assembly module TamA
MLELSTELRVPLAGRIGLVAFADAGNAWRAPSGITLSDLRVDAGPGVRYLSPVGPLRVDLAFQLNPIPGLLVDGKPQSRAWRLHLSIGQTF